MGEEAPPNSRVHERDLTLVLWCDSCRSPQLALAQVAFKAQLNAAARDHNQRLGHNARVDTRTKGT